jgi:endonuclease-8
MPEGDTIHTVARALRPRLVGRRIERAQLGDGNAGALEGRTVVAVRAHGKHLFLDLDSGVCLRTHLGMYGSWHRYAPGEVWRKPQRQASLIIATRSDVLVCFNARELEWLQDGGYRQRDLLQRLGPDLLAADFDLASVPARVREFLEPDTPVTDVLLDQRTACGIGNAYKSELLFLEHWHPLVSLGTLDDIDLRRLYGLARMLLGRNLGGGPRVTRFANDGAGRHWVYGRADQPCFRCRSRVRRALLGRDQRSTYWCPQCQPSHVGGNQGCAPR